MKNILVLVLLFTISGCSDAQQNTQEFSPDDVSRLEKESFQFANDDPVNPYIYSPINQAGQNNAIVKMGVSLNDIYKNLKSKQINSQNYTVNPIGFDSGNDSKINIDFENNFCGYFGTCQIFVAGEGEDKNFKNVWHIDFYFNNENNIPNKNVLDIMSSLIVSVKGIPDSEKIVSDLISEHNKKIANNEYEYCRGLVTSDVQIKGFIFELNTGPNKVSTTFSIYKSKNKPKKCY